MTFNCVYTEEAKQAIARVLGSRNYYVGVNGRMNFSAETDINKLVLQTMTG